MPHATLLPETVLRLSCADVLMYLEQQWGDRIYEALDDTRTVEGPAATRPDTRWLKTANTVGINVRTIGSFWKMVPYALTLPKAQNAIHILPIWEPGVVASLYGPCSWNINPAFFDLELYENVPPLDTVEKQLKVVINLLHLMGKSVGMDVVPHTDRYSEQALANPALFEWLQRDGLHIVRHDAGVVESVSGFIFDWAKGQGSAVEGHAVGLSMRDFFGHPDEARRLEILFGKVSDYGGRLARRKALIEVLYKAGFETVPATMGPPYRGIEADPHPDAAVTDEDGRIWRDYRITRPEKFSRVFGPLARYQFYYSKDDNRDWELDFSAPNRAAWQYMADHYEAIQRNYNFDFMRGDMSHVQMRPEGVPAVRDAWYDPLGAVKQQVLRTKPWFGYFAESFLAPSGEMAYGDECDHLEASFADTTLGDLQSEPVGTDTFMQLFARYRHWLETRNFAPNFTLMTADKDDPRFDRFYLTGNELRYFLGLFLTDMPSYMGLGFECRDPHPVPAPNEHYTKLYVFQEKNGPKSTNGPYQWGQNHALYAQIARQKALADALWPQIEGTQVAWLVPPDPSGQFKIIAWTLVQQSRYVFVAHFDTGQTAPPFTFSLPAAVSCSVLFSTAYEAPRTTVSQGPQGGTITLDRLAPGECLVLEVFL
jgi:hypothetical protein